MIRKGGVHYYCNIASPSLVDEEAIKNIDYDLDVKIFPNGKFIVLDEDEYLQHSRQMHYGHRLDVVVRQGLQSVLNDIALQKSPFDRQEIGRLYEKYLRLSAEKAQETGRKEHREEKKPVSYTHLDVYKRQAARRASSFSTRRGRMRMRSKS